MFTSLLDHLSGEEWPILSVSTTDIYVVSKEMTISQCSIIKVNLDMWPLELIVWEKQALFW